MYGRIITELHWEFSKVDELGLDQVRILFKYWNDQPPVHDMLRLRWFGGKKNKHPHINSKNFGEALKELGIG